MKQEERFEILIWLRELFSKKKNLPLNKRNQKPSVQRNFPQQTKEKNLDFHTPLKKEDCEPSLTWEEEESLIRTQQDKIRRIARIADKEAALFKKYYRDSVIAYKLSDRTKGLQLSKEGRSHEQKCLALNSQTHELRMEVSVAIKRRNGMPRSPFTWTKFITQNSIARYKSQIENGEIIVSAYMETASELEMQKVVIEIITNPEKIIKLPKKRAVYYSKTSPYVVIIDQQELSNSILFKLAKNQNGSSFGFEYFQELEQPSSIVI